MANDGKEERDQLLDSVVIGPIRDGRHKFVFEVSFIVFNVVYLSSSIFS